ncbi:hypothetical protein AAG906_026628 [Vitis piasezkii]
MTTLHGSAPSLWRRAEGCVPPEVEGRLIRFLERSDMDQRVVTVDQFTTAMASIQRPRPMEIDNRVDSFGQFRMPDIERYMVVGCLYTYLRLYSTVMRAHGLDRSQMITMFPLSLSERSMSSFLPPSPIGWEDSEIVDRPLRRDDSVLMVIRGLIEILEEVRPTGADLIASWNSPYMLHFIYEGTSFDHWVFEPSFLPFLSPYHLGLRYVRVLRPPEAMGSDVVFGPLLGQVIEIYLMMIDLVSPILTYRTSVPHRHIPFHLEVYGSSQICTIIIANWMLIETWTWSLPYGAPEIHPASSALLDAWMPSCLSIRESCTLIPTYEIHIDTMFPPWGLSGVTQLGLHLATLRCHHAFLPRDTPLIYGSGSVVHVDDLDRAFDDGFDDGFLSHVHSSEDIRCPFSHWSMRHDWRISSGVLYTGAYPFSVEDGFRYGCSLEVFRFISHWSTGYDWVIYLM